MKKFVILALLTFTCIAPSHIHAGVSAYNTEDEIKTSLKLIHQILTQNHGRNETEDDDEDDFDPAYFLSKFIAKNGITNKKCLLNMEDHSSVVYVTNAFNMAIQIGDVDSLITFLGYVPNTEEGLIRLQLRLRDTDDSQQHKPEVPLEKKLHIIDLLGEKGIDFKQIYGNCGASGKPRLSFKATNSSEVIAKALLYGLPYKDHKSNEVKKYFIKYYLEEMKKDCFKQFAFHPSTLRMWNEHIKDKHIDLKGLHFNLARRIVIENNIKVLEDELPDSQDELIRDRNILEILNDHINKMVTAINSIS